MPGSVVLQTGVRRALSGAALIEQHYPIIFGIKELPVLRHETTTGTAMKKHDRLPFRISTLLIIELMNCGYFQPANVVWLDRGV
jgi:hypothetical protein